MSDPYNFPDPDNIADFGNRRAQAQAQLAMDDSPDDAARAIDLGKATGIPAPVVHSDLEGVDRDFKSKLTAGIIENNKFIQDYVNAHPLAASVSNDDYGQLDAASGAIGKLGQKGFIENTGDIIKGVWHGLSSGPEEYKQIADGSKDFLLKLGMSEEQATREAGDISRRAYRNEEFTNLLFALPTLAFSPVFGAFRTYAAQPLERQFGIPAQVTEGLAMGIAGWLGLKGGLSAEAKLNKTAERVAPYLKNGEMPPVGVDEIVDKIHLDQAKADKDALNDALKESAASATRDRAPDLFAEFARSHPSAQGDIGISADAIRGLYGDKVPSSDDGVLGWIPDLQAKLESAEATGGDVKVPLADYLAKVEPEIHREIVDHIRVRDGGLTVEEGKTLKEEQAAVEPEAEAAPVEGEPVVPPSGNELALQTVRQAAGIDGEAKPTTEAKQLELPQAGTTNIAERKPFAGPPPGFTKQMYDLYLKKIADRRADDAEWVAKRALEFERKTQTAEWKANRTEMRTGVKAEVEAQPMMELDKMLRDGDIKLSEKDLTDEQRASLPKEYIAKDGIHPDDLANLLGGDTGRELISELSGLASARGVVKPQVFLRDFIDKLTDQRMEEKFGDLDKNIISEAQDHVLSAIQEEILHQETMARANEAGLEYSINPDQLRAAVVRNFNELPIGSISAKQYLTDAGRASRKGEVALLKSDTANAFREAQRREFAFIAAKEAAKVEKEMKSFERTAKRFSSREVKGVDQEYTNWAHQILLRVGSKVNRSLQDLGDAIGRADEKSLEDFVNYKESYGLKELPVADFLLDPAWKKDFEKLTVNEFRAVKDSIKALEHNGREEMLVYKNGEAADLEAIKAKMLEQIVQFPVKEFDPQGKIVQPFAGVRRVFRTALVSHLQAETVMNRLDRFNPKGVFSQYVFRELASGANNEALMLREYSKKLGAVADDANLREKIQNNIFTEPFNKVDPVEVRNPMSMTRKNLRAVLLNAGNENNLWKMARGYGLDPTTVRDWLHQNATKQDWDWAQKVWDIFAELKDKSDTMYRSLSGIEPEGLEIKPVETPHGTYKGGYYPLIRHPMFSEDIKTFKDGLEGQGYVRATTPAGYTKSRTGAIYPLSLDLDSLPNQLRQVIHDISLRPAVLQAAKIFYDKGLMAQMKRHLGPEYANMFVPWLRDVANVQNFISSSEKSFNYWSDFMRQNAVTTLVGFNPGTAMKHTPTALISSMAEVGPANFLKALRSMVSINEETGDKNWRFAISQSEELQRRSRNWTETMGGGLAQLEGRTTGQALKQGDYGSAFMSLREAITELSSKPVALGDLLSAVPTWIAKYEGEMNDHGIHGDAVAAADKAVRQAHGSSAITSRSSVARNQSALAKWTTGFFTFFNDLFNRQVETIWRAGEIRGMVDDGRKADAMKEAANVSGRLFAYVIAPAMIEELVSPLASDDNESFGVKAAKSLAFTLSSSWVGVRDLVSAVLNKRDPSVGLLTTVGKSATDFLRDFQAKKGAKTENVIKHGTQLSGMLTGLTPAPIGRAAEFGYKVQQGIERPRGPWGWLVGLRYGTTKGHSDTFEHYIKGK